MAGPGGGPPRKSHTKSRKGCKTCKRRHIRCDENFPQCRNCTKHSCRCDYMDAPPQADDHPGARSVPDLPRLPPQQPEATGVWTPAIETNVDAWIRSGIYPFPELGLHNHQTLFADLSRFDHRLVYHVSDVYKDLQRKGCLYLTPWVGKLPDFFECAVGHRFVMSAILAFSAQHLADETGSPDVGNLAYQHRGVALTGLTQAIGALTPTNSDPILAASILLLWQEPDWAGWTSLMQGTALVLSSVAEWKLSLRFAQFVEDHVQAQEPKPLFLSQTMGGVMAPILPEDDQSLEEALTSMMQLLPFLHGNAFLRQSAEEHLHAARDFHMSSGTMRLEQLFARLQTLRMRLLWAPVRLVATGDPSRANLLVVAHLYALAMSIDASLPELQGAAFGALMTAPLAELDRALTTGHAPHGLEPATLDALMAFPRRITMQTRASRYVDPNAAGNVGTPGLNDDALSTGQQSPYGLQNLGLGSLPGSGPTTPNFPPSFPQFPANISVEDLSMPPSPFLSSWVHPPSPAHSAAAMHVAAQQNPHTRRPSGLPESGHGHSPRPSSITFEQRPSSIAFDRRSFSGFSSHGGSQHGGFGGDSPQYSHGAPSPVPSQYLDQDDGTGSRHNSFLGEVPSLGEIPSAGPLAWPFQEGFTVDESMDKNKGIANFQ